MRRCGFTLIELLIGMAISLVILMAGLSFFIHARSLFFKLKDSEETRLSGLATLEKIRGDVLRAGRALQDPIRLGLVEGLSAEDGRLTLQSREMTLSPLADLSPGQARILFQEPVEVVAGRTVCIHDGTYGETHTVSASGKGWVELDSPLAQSYGREKARVVILETVSFFLDEAQGILRRRANAGSAQPLCEGVAAWNPLYDPDRNLLTVTLKLEEDNNPYEMLLHATNMALALGR